MTPDRHTSRPSRICVDPMMMLILMGLLAALVVPSILLRPTRGFVSAVALLVGGVTCLALAKSSLWRQRIWISWGSSRRTRGYATLYKWGWVGIGSGILLLLLTLRFVANSRM